MFQAQKPTPFTSGTSLEAPQVAFGSYERFWNAMALGSVPPESVAIEDQLKVSDSGRIGTAWCRSTRKDPLPFSRIILMCAVAGRSVSIATETVTSPLPSIWL